MRPLIEITHLGLHASDMILHTQSDASYLSRPAARSVVGGIHYLGWKNDKFRINGGVMAVSTILTTVAASAAEAEYGAVFVNGQVVAWLRTVLKEMGYPQIEATLMLCDNKCAVGIANDTIKAKRSKAMDMRYHWIRDRVKQNELTVEWCRGDSNLADFFTKPLPVHEYWRVRPQLVHTPVDHLNPSVIPHMKRLYAHAHRQNDNTS